MSKISHLKPLAIVWRAVKVLLGAWGFAVAGIIVFAVGALFVGSPDAVNNNSLPYVTAVLFLLGIPIMMRWLK